jgi:hypothetical protein
LRASSNNSKPGPNIGARTRCLVLVSVPAAADGERELINPSSIKSLPKLLRNSIAHFNVLPLKENGRFSGVRVWNKDEACRERGLGQVHLRISVYGLGPS